MADYIRHPLDPSFARVRRANEHFSEIGQQIAEVFKRQADSIVVEFDPNPPYRLKVNPPLETFFGMRIPILIGEFCYNLRSALDWLVYQLALLDSHVEQSNTQFPIVDAQQNFVTSVPTGALKGVSAAHIAAIERLQPFNGVGWTARLRDCSNPDKHRHLIAGGGSFSASATSSLERDIRPLSGTLRKVIHPVHGGVDVKLHYAAIVTFPDGTWVLDTLEEISAGVEDTLNLFKPDF